MESPIWPESLPIKRIKAIQELVQGEKWTDKLRDVLQWSGKPDPDPTPLDDVVVQILGMFENTLSIMAGSCNVNESLQVPKSELRSSSSSDGRKSDNSDESPRTVIPVKLKRGCYKRRKNSWISTKVTSVLIDDGHAWRKYGQKEILNTEHQRSYYRCTYKLDQGCQATKHVQKIQDKPPNYKITYFGHHTCNNLQRAPPIILESRDHSDTSILLNFETKELVEKKQVNPYLPTIKYEPMEGFPTSSANVYQSCDQFTNVPHNPLESGFDNINAGMVLGGVYSELNHGDMTSSSSQINEMDQLFGMNEFNDFSF